MPLLMYPSKLWSGDSISELCDLSSIDDDLVVDLPVTSADTLLDPLPNPVLEEDEDDHNKGEGVTSKVQLQLSCMIAVLVCASG